VPASGRTPPATRSASHLLEDRQDIRTVGELLDHKDVSTTMICTHVGTTAATGVRIPLDRL
jgi:site-specific recombinase XerD